MKPSVKGEFPSVLDSTIIGEWKACPTKCYYGHFRHLGPQWKSVDLVAGGAFARGLEVFRLKYYGEQVGIEAAMRAAVPEIIVAYGDLEVPPGKEAKSLARVIEGLVAYLQHWDPRTDEIQPFMSNGKPSVEFTFSLPLPITHPETGEPLIYGGRFDLLGVRQGLLWVVDEKTTTQLGASWSAKWNMRAQFTGYCHAAREYGQPVAGAIVRGISFLSNKAGTFGFEQSLQLRDDHMINSWWEEILFTVEEMKNAYISNRYSQNFGDSCAAYSNCGFMQLCQSPTPETWIPGRFGVRKWNPLNPNPEIEVETAPAIESIKLLDAMKGL